MKLQNATPKKTGIDTRLAHRSRYLRSNVIRDMLQAAGRPGIISLGGGNPAKESFPVKYMPKLMKNVMKKYASTALQYSDTQGFLPLRDALANWLLSQGIPASTENLLITAGSQSALDLLAKLLINEQNPVFVETPTYLGALQAFSLFNPSWQCVSEDAEGPLPESMREILTETCSSQQTPVLYIMPTFRNPTGTSWSVDRRLALCDAIKNHNNWIIEDDPYRLLYYENPPPLPIKCSLPDQTLYLGTLSKVFAPGLRLGYCIVPDYLKPWLVKTKQGTDLNTSTLSQALAAEYLNSGRLQEQLPMVVNIYRKKRDALAEALQTYLSPWFQFDLPAGGMFLWIKGPPYFQSSVFLEFAMKHGVFFVPGTAFYSDNSSLGERQMRLNFSGVERPLLNTAAKRLRNAFEEYQQHID